MYQRISTTRLLGKIVKAIRKGCAAQDPQVPQLKARINELENEMKETQMEMVRFMASFKVAWEVVCLPRKEGGLGDGNKASAWFNNWCSVSPMADIVSNRDIYSAGFGLLAKVNEIINDDAWSWPNDWLLKYPRLVNLDVPNLSNADDGLVWRDRNNVDSRFSVATAWECIRPRANELKTQDTLRQWDVSSNTNLNLLMCPLCDTQQDSHDHFFFGCVFSSKVWDHVMRLTGLSNMPFDLNSIVDFLIPLNKMRSARSVIAKLVFAASCYFIWQERNNRLFMKTKRSQDQVIDIIKSTVRLKLLSCKSKRTKNVQIEDAWFHGLEGARKVECSPRAVLFFPSPSLGVVQAVA
ncbi:hypothetical protein Tco_0982113 [Tanacetum coccineum]